MEKKKKKTYRSHLLKYQTLYDWILIKCNLRKTLITPHFNETLLNIYEAVTFGRDMIIVEKDKHRLTFHL